MAVLPQFRTGTHVFTTHDGERMVYYTLGERSSPPVLLLHGCELVDLRRASCYKLELSLVRLPVPSVPSGGPAACALLGR
jgi:hypothetical protein